MIIDCHTSALAPISVPMLLPGRDRQTNPQPHRGGTVASLPLEMRQQINQMLRDNRPYSVIVAHAASAGFSLSRSALSRWRKSGFQDWCRDQLFLRSVEQQQQFARDLLENSDPSQLTQASIHLLTTKLLDITKALNTTLVDTSLQQDPMAYCRMVRTFCRLLDSLASQERSAVDLTERRAALKRREPSGEGGLSEEALHKIEAELNLF